MKIGLLLIATNKYTDFLQQIIDSADKHFLLNHEVTYFIFSDKTDIKINTNRSYTCLNVEHKAFPYSTLMRYHHFSKYQSLLSGMDYLYYSDVDMRFVGDVNDEILGERVFTKHCGYYHIEGNYNDYQLKSGVWNPIENNPNTTAYIKPNEIVKYYCGGFNGGTTKEFLKMSNVISTNIDVDIKNNVVAKWHDESHLNRYALDNPPTVELSPSYCYAESVNLPFEKKLLALDKNHNYYRT